MNDLLAKPRPSTSLFSLYDHQNAGGSRSPLTVIWIQGLPGLWTESEPSTAMKDSTTVTAVTSSCVTGNATELCRAGLSSDVWELRSGDSSGPVYPTWAVVLMGLLAGCMSLVTVSGNLIVILSFFIERTIRQPTNYFIASLAVSDLLIGAVSMPFYTVYLLTGQHWPLGEVLCDLWLSVDYTVCLCSIYTVFCITIDRFCSVRIPAKYRNWRTERKVLAVVALTWVVPALVFFPSVFGWQCFVGQRTVPKGKCYVQYMEDALFNCFLQVGYFWVTLAAMCGLYGGIYRVALNLQQKSDLKQKTTKLASSSAGQKTAAITRSGVTCVGGGDEAHVGRKEEDTTGNDADGRVGEGRRIVNNGGCDSSIRGGGGKGGGVTNGREEEVEREDSLSSSPDYPGIVYPDGKPDDGQHLSGSFIHHENGTRTPDEKDREKGGKTGGGTKKKSVDVTAVVNAQYQHRNLSRDRKPVSESISLRRSDDGNRSSPNLFSGGRCLTEALVGKTRKAVFIDRSGYGAAGGYEEDMAVEYPAHFEVRWLSEDDLESRLFEENVRLLVRSHRIDSSTATDSAGEEPGSPVWKKRDSATSTERCSLLVSVDDDRSTQYQSTLQQTTEGGRRARRNGKPRGQIISHAAGGAGNGVDGARQDVRGYRRIFARIREWRENSGHRLSIDDDQTPSPPPDPLPPPPPPLPPLGVCSRVRQALSNGDIELKRFAGRESAVAVPVMTKQVDDRRDPDHPCSNQSSLRAQGASGGTATPFKSVLRRLRKFDDSVKREESDGESGRKCKRVNRARKALRTITVILGAFVVCWTPWHVLSMIIGFCPKEIVCVTPVLYDISYWLCYLNSPLNPFCYALANQQFKKTFARILKFDWHRT